MNKSFIVLSLAVSLAVMTWTSVGWSGQKLKIKNAKNIALKYCGGNFSIGEQRDGKIHLVVNEVVNCSLVEVNDNKKIEINQRQENDLILKNQESYELRFFSKAGNTWDTFVVENPQEPTFNFSCQCITRDNLFFPPPVTVQASNINEATDLMADACSNPLIKLGYRGDLKATRAACR